MYFEIKRYKNKITPPSPYDDITDTINIKYYLIAPTSY